MMNEKIKISYGDLRDPTIDDLLKRQTEELALRRGEGAGSLEEGKVSLIHKSWFNLMIAGAVGALIGWALIEPHFDESLIEQGKRSAASFLLFATVGGFTGLMVGSMEGILARNYTRACKGGAIGLGIGFGGGLVSTFVAGIVFSLIALLGVGMVGIKGLKNPTNLLIIGMLARTPAWAVAGMTVGLGPGIALKSSKMVFNGFIGGMIGGAIGGMLFDPINFIVSGGTLQTGAGLSRAIGLLVIGASTGLLIGMVEMLTKDAWLLMTAGPLTGKQFIVYKNPTIIGSSPKCEIYLFKDPAIEPFHGALHIIRDGYELEDKNTSSGIYVNGQRIKRRRLMNGDEIQIGNVKFSFSEKEKKGRT